MIGSASAGAFPAQQRAIYLPNQYGARKLLIDRYWTKLNVGVFFRQRRRATWNWPTTLAGRKVAFGLCSGTASPYGVASPTHFIGVRTNTPWTRLTTSNWWTTGWKLITHAGSTETVHTSGSDGTMRVSSASDWRASAWYLRFTRTSATDIKLELFVPTGRNEPTQFDFEEQLDRSTYQVNVNNHSQYAAYSATFTHNEVGLGYLNAFNICSDLDDIETAELGGVEWLDVKAVMIQ